MSRNSLHGRISFNQKIRPSSSFTHKLRRRLLAFRSQEKRIRRCKSEPALSTVDVEDNGRVIAQRWACTDAFSSSQDIVLPAYSSLPKFEGCKFNKNGKVVVNVTVEGSPGPVRTMLKLGSSVGETMEIIKKQYHSEGRCPHLDLSTFELHQSYFSLQCLDKSDLIGDLGSRSFFMRKCNNGNSFIDSEIISTMRKNSTPRNPIVAFPDSIFYCLKKIIRFSSKLFKILGCIDR